MEKNSENIELNISLDFFTFVKYSSRSPSLLGAKLNFIEIPVIFSNDFITTDTEQMDLYQEDNTTPNVLSHQYDSPGLKTIKATIFSEDSLGNSLS